MYSPSTTLAISYTVWGGQSPPYTVDENVESQKGTEVVQSQDSHSGVFDPKARTFSKGSC